MSERDEWQPIATAPRDGTDVLLWRGPKMPPVVGACSPEWGAAWYSHDNFDGPVEGVITHWCPIPPPPKGGGE